MPVRCAWLSDTLRHAKLQVKAPGEFPRVIPEPGAKSPTRPEFSRRPSRVSTPLSPAHCIQHAARRHHRGHHGAVPPWEDPPETRRLPPELEAALVDTVGRAHVLVGDTTNGYSVDWTGRFHGHAAAVIRPGSEAQCRAVVAHCAQARHPLVPQGGNTGLVGGSVPLGGEIVLSTTRLDDLDPVDETAAQVTAGAGVSLADLQRHARRAHLRYGVDFAARASATVGGMIATNAGGINVVRFGPTRSQVVGIRAVLADGSVVGSLAGLEKDNTGLHLPSVLCGSEGTLGVITAARLRLHPIPPHTVTALMSLDSADAAIAAVSRVRTIAGLEACELMLRSGVELVTDQLGAAPPVAPSAAYLIVEAASSSDPTADMGEILGEVPGVVAVAVAADGPGRARLWRHREAHTEAINRLGAPHKLDVTLPLGRLGEFVDRVQTVVATERPEAELWLFGHAADGNLHVNVTGLRTDDEALDLAVLELVAALEGSISAEHGIGTVKRPYLGLSRSPADIAAMRAIRTALDPIGILNPKVLLPPEYGQAAAH